MREDNTLLHDIERYLACPHCGQPLVLDGRSLSCATGHSFDQARQGYANLLAGDAHTGTGDTADMVTARSDFLATGHYRPIADALAEAAVAALGPAGLVADLGAGTGYYLAQVLEQLGDSCPGAALDISKYALRRAARAHPRIGAVVCDAWRPLPLQDSCAALVLNVFAPRNGPEIRRVLRPGGTLLVVSPTPRHLRELVDALGLLSVDEDKDRRTAGKLGPYLTPGERREVEFRMQLTPADVQTVVAMGPNAWHARRAGAAGPLPGAEQPVEVTASVTVTAYHRPGPVSTPADPLG